MPSLRIGIDVGGTNTDAVLLDASGKNPPRKSVLAWHKTATTPDITSGIQKAVFELLALTSFNPDDVICVTIGTTHLINALVERDGKRLQRVGVIRLSSEEFTRTTPPFVEFPADLRERIYGGYAFAEGGLQIDGTLIGSIDEQQIKKVCEGFEENRIQNIVVCGTCSPIDSIEQQERSCKKIVLKSLGPVNVVCSCDVAGLGILERENASILNATIHTYASFVFKEICNALQTTRLQDCPVFISSNDGSMAPVEEATQTPIRFIASGPANSMFGASSLDIERSPYGGVYRGDNPQHVANTESVIILDIGGTTTDAGMLMANGYPRQASAYSTIAGAQVNFSMPDVSSTGLGGGTIVTTDACGSAISIGPESVGNGLTTKALCFGGETLTLTDIAVAAGEARVGSVPVSLMTNTIFSAQDLVIAKLEDIIISAKTQAKPLPIAVVGGGAIICPRRWYCKTSALDSKLTSIANALGAGCAQLSATIDKINDTSNAVFHQTEKEMIEATTADAVEKCLESGAHRDHVRTVERQIFEIPYITGKTRIVVKVAGPLDEESMRQARASKAAKPAQLLKEEVFQEQPREYPDIVLPFHNLYIESLVSGSNILDYHPKISNKMWMLSEVDIEWLSIGCYILGCGGGGSPHLSSISAKQLLRHGKMLKIVNAKDLPATAILPPVGILGSPMVSIERAGGSLAADALDTLLGHQRLESYNASLSIEIGGLNGLTPLFCGRPDREDSPMIDGDLMGRAFPTFEMVTTYLVDLNINNILPASLSSGTGSNMVLQSAQNTAAVDSILRACCVTMGCAAGVVSRPLTASEFIEKGILHTHSAAWRIGRAVKASQAGCTNLRPAEAIVDACGGPRSAKILFHGRITDVLNHLIKGHSVGQLVIEGFSPPTECDSSMPEGSKSPVTHTPQQLHVSFKNENLIAELMGEMPNNKKVLATVPDLIALLDSRTGLGVGVPEYKFGLRVSVIAIAAPPQWTSPRGLAMAGPSHFG